MTPPRQHWLASLILYAGISLPISALAESPCAAPARAQAKKLLDFHSGDDDRVQIDNTVKELPALRNPAEPKQLFKVLEVWGSIYKGQYRMRLIYHVSGAHCVLMGQELLEIARL